jgi:hypothetical protein
MIADLKLALSLIDALNKAPVCLNASPTVAPLEAFNTIMIAVPQLRD